MMTMSTCWDGDLSSQDGEDWVFVEVSGNNSCLDYYAWICDGDIVIGRHSERSTTESKNLVVCFSAICLFRLSAGYFLP